MSAEKKSLNYCRQLSDFDISVRRFAAKKLVELADPVSITYLIDVLADSDVLVKTNAEDALVAIGEEVVDSLCQAIDNKEAEVRLRAVSVYRRLKTNVKLENFVKLIYDEDKMIRNSIKARLYQTLSAKASSELWSIIKDTSKSKELRDEAFQILEKNIIGIDSELLKDIKDEKLDTNALKIAIKLYLILKPNGNEFFMDKNNSQISEYRIAYLKSYSAKNSEKSIDIAKIFTDDEDIEVRKSAVEIIGVYGTKDDIEFLQILQNTPNKGVWKIAKNSIYLIENKK
ncbi:MAG: HEAT repeat domain-containing protein [Candidatus Heimdallarchaeota archaeon]|nr:HEAT repeat domain-containing protein [Candidatus Heimdallarchaeota archaeon]MDH5646742.1 HEAT repeat domain-containing protein [Candidatus Heimdallarchaeota archaeon]